MATAFNPDVFRWDRESAGLALEDDEDTQPLAFIGSARVADGVAALVRAIEQ